MSRSKKIIRYLTFSAWAVWALTAVFLLVSYGASASFVILYVFYLVLGGAVLRITRSDILSPPGFFTLAGFLAFGLSFVLVYTGTRNIQTGDLTWLVVSDEALFRALTVFLVASAAFILGYYSPIYRYIPLRWLGRVPQNSRKVSIATYLVLVFVVVIAGIIRIQFHLGEAGRQPSIPFAGVLHYTFFDGVLLASMWFLAQGLRQGRLYILLGLSLLLMLAATQALLGWRGAIIQMMYGGIGLFWYQTQYRQTRRPHAFGWLLVLVVSAGTLIQLGNEVRSTTIGGAAEFATSFGEFVQKIAFRGQGTTRLAAITDHFGALTFFNDFFIRDLIRQGLNATTYIDRTLYAVGIKQLHSVGTSGPGGPYVAMGLFGVAGAYLLLGSFCRSVYSGMMSLNSDRNNILYIVLYSYMLFRLTGLLAENFGMAFIKNMIAVLTVLFALTFVIGKRHARG